MALSTQEVLHVAKLANLKLDPAEVASLAAELGAIVEYVAELEQVDTENVEPTTFLSVTSIALRKDGAAAGLSQEQATAEAPQSRGGAFAVPTFMED